MHAKFSGLQPNSHTNYVFLLIAIIGIFLSQYLNIGSLIDSSYSVLIFTKKLDKIKNF